MNILSFFLNITQAEFGCGTNVHAGPPEFQLSIYNCSVCMFLWVIGSLQSEIKGGPEGSQSHPQALEPELWRKQRVLT